MSGSKAGVIWLTRYLIISAISLVTFELLKITTPTSIRRSEVIGSFTLGLLGILDFHIGQGKFSLVVFVSDALTEFGVAETVTYAIDHGEHDAT